MQTFKRVLVQSPIKVDGWDNALLINRTIIALLVLFLLYQFADVWINKPNAPRLINWDTAGYTTALVQHDIPGTFNKDTIWANHKFTDSIWASSGLYMAGLDIFLKLSGGNIALAYGLFRIFLLALYIPLMYMLLLRVIQHRWLAFALSLLSAHPATFTVTGVSWGIPNDLTYLPIVPETLYTLFALSIVLIAYEFWFKPGVKHQRINPWILAALGLLVGISVYLVHSISSIEITELLIVLGLAQVLRRKLPLWSLILFAVVVAPWLVIRSTVASGVPIQLSLADTNAVMAFGQRSMVFPWEERWGLATLKLPSISTTTFVLSFFVIYGLATAISLLLIIRKRSRYLGKFVFVTAQAIYYLIWMSAGWIPMILWAYGAYRIWSRTDDELDYGLIMALTIANLIGPLQQTFVYYLWYSTKINGLLGLLYEMARFQRSAYIPFYLLLGRAVLCIVRVETPRRIIRVAIAVVLLVLIFLNLQQWAYPIGPLRLEQFLVLALILSRVGFTLRRIGNLSEADLIQDGSYSAKQVRALYGWSRRVRRWYQSASRWLVNEDAFIVRRRAAVTALLIMCAVWWSADTVYANLGMTFSWRSWLVLSGLFVIAVCLSQAVNRRRTILSVVLIIMFACSIPILLPQQINELKHIIKFSAGKWQRSESGMDIDAEMVVSCPTVRTLDPFRPAHVPY
jgi:hypothetical protein